MNFKPLIFNVLITSLIISCAPTQALFKAEGTDWILGGDADWKFSEAEIIGTSTGGAGFLMTKASFGDFMLDVEFYPDSTVNSGIFVRCKNQELSYTDCYEINIWDHHPNQENRTGAIVSRAASLTRVTTVDQWNTYKIQMKGSHLKAWINGILTTDLYDENLKGGYIGLQAAETGKVKFRKIRIKVL